MPELFVEPIEKSFGDLQTSFGGGVSFFEGLTKAALGFIKSPLDGFKSLLEMALDADSLKALEPEQLAYHLIYQGLTQAAYKLLDDHKNTLGPRRTRGEPIAEKLDRRLQQIRLTIDAVFFHSTRQLPFWPAIEELFAQWLANVFDISAETSQALSHRLPFYFDIALDEEWSRHPDTYKILKDKLKTPLTPLAKQSRGWLHYLDTLEEAITRPILGEDFGLQPIYIPLRGYYEQEILGEKSALADSYHREEKKYRKVAVDLETSLNDWLARNDRRDALRVISGEPGSGKSCLARMFAARQSWRGDRRVWFIPLHLFDATAGLEGALRDFAARQRLFGDNSLPWRFREERQLLIFDALDELELGGKAWEEISRQFIERLEAALVDWNRDEAAVLVLITGRILAVREYRHRFCRESWEAILQVLPYYLPKSHIERDFGKDSQKFLKIDQREDWWRQYGRACRRDFAGLPQELRQEKLDELTSRPILNHLVAQLHRDGRLELTGESNINSVYYQMIRAIYDRGWEPHRPHDVTKNMYLDQFLRTLEEIAVAAWHGDRRRAREADIQERLEKAPPLKEILKSFKRREGGKVVSRLLTGFYFGPGEESLQGDRTYEFTHKSFGEYLFARSLVRLLENIHHNYAENLNDYQRGWNARSCLDAWAKLCGPSPLDEDLFRLVQNEIFLLKNAELVAQWQETLAALIGFMLAHGMWGEELPRLSYQELCRQARNAELALLVSLNACAWVTENISTFILPSRVAAGEWLARLLGQRNGFHELPLACLSFLNLSGQHLVMRDFVRANLHRADLRKANLSETNLGGANLSNANLGWANLGWANLNDSNLSKANLSGAILIGADLIGTDLRGAYLRGANLIMANLRVANLGGADLSATNLGGANLRRADLIGADLGGADLQNVRINEATKVKGIKIAADTKISKGSELENLLKKEGII